MEDYHAIAEAILRNTNGTEVRAFIKKTLETMKLASELDIVAAQWMAGGALLTSDEPLLDRGDIPDIETSKHAQQVLNEYGESMEEQSVDKDLLAYARQKKKLKSSLHQYRTFTQSCELLFIDTLEHILQNAEEGLAFDIHNMVYNHGYKREHVARYIRRHASTVAVFSTTAGKLYASRQRMRSIGTSNRRSNELHVYEHNAIEDLLERHSTKSTSSSVHRAFDDSESKTP
eukprot:873633-Rhodomonas_salina.3